VLAVASLAGGCFDFPIALLADARRDGIRDGAAADGTRDGAAADVPPDWTRDGLSADGDRDGRSKDAPATDLRKDGPAKPDAKKDGPAKPDVKPPPDAKPPADACSPCPPGWIAVLYNDRNPGSPLPCPSGWKYFSTSPVMTGPPLDPGCSSCSCGTPTGRTCTATFECRHNGNCTAPSNCSGNNLIPGDSSCHDFGCDNGCSDALVTACGPTGGSCSPSATSQPLAYSWPKAHDLCVPNGATQFCNSACVAAGAPYAGCIVRAGDYPCPGGTGQKHLFYAGASDGRSCSACGCGPPAGGSCASTATLYPCAGCQSGGTGPLTVTIGTCAKADQNIKCVGTSIASARYGGVANAGACVPSGGVKSGAVTTSSPVTICCP
jgi:hypothetical protein